MANIESLWDRLFKQSHDKNWESQINLGGLEVDIDEIDIPDGTKSKIPEMPLSRPHWG